MYMHFDLSVYATALINAYRRFPAKDSTLDLDFVNNRGVIAGVAGGALDRATVTRSTTATYFDAAGNIQMAAINTARFGYNVTSWLMLGLMVETTRSNLLLNSLIDKTVLSTQSVTVTAQSYALSFYGTGSITLSGTASGTLTGTSNTVKSVLVFTPTVGSLTLTVSGNVFWAQLEAGINSTSFIPTDGTSKSRSADVIVMTGADFSDWYSQSGGTLTTQYELPHNVTNSRAVGISNGTTTNSIEVVAGASNGSGGYVYISTAGVGQATVPIFAASTPSTANIYRIAGKYSINGASAANQGQLGVSQTAISMPTVDRMYIGSGGSGTSQLNGYIRRITYIPRLLQNHEISGVSR